MYRMGLEEVEEAKSLTRSGVKTIKVKVRVMVEEEVELIIAQGKT